MDWKNPYAEMQAKKKTYSIHESPLEVSHEDRDQNVVAKRLE